MASVSAEILLLLSNHLCTEIALLHYRRETQTALMEITTISKERRMCCEAIITIFGVMRIS